ncbi:MAG: metallophosphoesterase [Planctomycetes bacterium]|nr:metallophosphoesterase [Planctomycetota bacterium]
MARRIFVGDIQGCRAELETLLERVRFDPASDVLEPVGDVVNRGPDSLGTLRLLLKLGAGGVLGNHDLHLLRVARGLRKSRPGDTLGAVLAAPDRDELCAWLASRPFVKAWSDVILVHGALHPKWRDPMIELAGLDPLTPDARSDFATRARYCAPDGARPERDDPPPEPPFAPWFEHWLATKRDPRTLVFGHWAMLGLVVRPGLRGLDTGCVWGKSLTAWIAEEDRLVQVPAEKQYAAFD